MHMYIKRDWERLRGVHFGACAVNLTSMVIESECQVRSQVKQLLFCFSSTACIGY